MFVSSCPGYMHLVGLLHLVFSTIRLSFQLTTVDILFGILTFVMRGARTFIISIIY